MRINVLNSYLDQIDLIWKIVGVEKVEYLTKFFQKFNMLYREFTIMITYFTMWYRWNSWLLGVIWYGICGEGVFRYF